MQTQCKHSDVISISEQGKKYFCKVKQKRISSYDCRDCMLYLPSLPSEFEKVFGKGFSK